VRLFKLLSVQFSIISDPDIVVLSALHLIGEKTQTAHVLLKCEAFKLLTVQLSIISDLDMIV